MSSHKYDRELSLRNSFPPGVGVILIKTEFLSYAFLRWKLCIVAKYIRKTLKSICESWQVF